MVTETEDGSGDFPIQRMWQLGRQSKAVAWFPYGYHANLPANTLALTLAAQGLPEGRVLFGGSPYTRNDPAGPLASGEVMMYHPGSSSYLHFKEGGHVDFIMTEDDSEFWIQCDGDGVLTSNATLVAGVTTVTVLGWGGVTIAAGAPVVLQGTTLDVNCAGGADFSHGVAIHGVLVITGEATGNFLTHTHSGVTTGSDDTGGVN